MKIQEFFKTVKSSVWGPEHYAVMASRSIRGAIGYLLSLIFLVSFLIIVFISVFAVPAGIAGINYGSVFVAEKYPTDLVLTFKDGAVTTKVAKPYVFKIPKNDLVPSKKNVSSDKVENFVVIDTSINFENISQFESAKTSVLLAKNAIVVSKEGGFDVRPIPKEFNFIVTKEMVLSKISSFLPLVKYIIPVIIILGMLGLFVLTAIKYLVASLITGLLIWLIGKIAKRQGAYKEFFVTALYANTLPLILGLVLFFFGQSLGLPGGWDILIATIVWAVNVKIWEKPNLPTTKVGDAPMNV